jgi:drug/metabolite transporter (DMT)-like permease
MAFTFAIGNSLLFRGTRITEASEVSVLFASYTIWAIVTAAFILHETVKPLHIVGILLVISGIIIISAKKSGWKLTRGHLFILASAFFFGLGFTLNAYFTKYIPVASYLVLGFLFPVIALSSLYPHAVPKTKKLLSLKYFPTLLVTCFFYALAAVTIFLAYTLGGQASQIVPISQSSIILTVLLSYIFLGERDHLPQKILGSIIVFAGVLFLK